MATPSSELSGDAALEVAQTAVPVDVSTAYVPEADESETGRDATSSEQQDERKQQPTSPGMSLERIAVLLCVTYFLVACLPFCYQRYQEYQQHQRYVQRLHTSISKRYVSQIHDRVPHDNIVVLGETAMGVSPCNTHEESVAPLQPGFGEKATELDPDNFRGFVERDGFAFVAFNAPWCIWSQRMTPVWHDFAAEVEREGIPVRIATVDCAAHADLCREARIMAFPTMRWYRDGKPSVETYRKDRTVVGFMEFARRKIDEPEEFQVAHSMLRGVHETYDEMDDDVTEWIEAKEMSAKIEEPLIEKEESFFQEENPDDMAVNQRAGGVHELESVYPEVNKAEASKSEAILISASAYSDGAHDDEENGLFNFDLSNWDHDHGETAYEEKY